MKAVSIGLILGAFIAASCSADQSGIMTTGSAAAPACSASGPASSLHLEGGGGEQLHLAYFAGCGWKYIAADHTARGKTGLEKVSDPAVSSAASAVPARENPMTVYIDGPTGYVFGWTPENGWKFVGHLQP
jgi:hypothetical protein